MPKVQKDPNREKRIEMEIIVDAYDESERAMGWYQHTRIFFQTFDESECDHDG